MTGQITQKGYTVDLDVLLTAAKAEITWTARLVGYGLTISETADPEGIQLPGALFQLAIDPEPSITDTKDAFKDWLSGMCLRRYVEGYNRFLESAGVVASLIRSNEEGTLQSWNGQECAHRMNRRGFPNKLDYINQTLAIGHNPTFDAYLTSINKARNVFEHRGGIVQQVDVNTPEGQLVVSWHGIDLFGWPGDADPPGPNTDITERVITTIPATLGENESLMQRTGARSKSFSVGDKLTFSANELPEMGLTFIVHASELAVALKQSHDGVI